MPPHVLQWLRERGLSQTVIDGLIWRNDGWIGIPILKEDGTTVMKYRRDPAKDGTDIPKYKNPHGQGSTLYGHETLPSSDTVYLCEGEFDALRLRSDGLVAVSSTIGANGWKIQWNRLFSGKTVYIVYDADEAGQKGAAKTGSQIQREA